MMITVYFDGDQTLWDFQALMRRTMAATIGELERRVGPLTGDSSVEAFVADREVVARAGADASFEDIRESAFRRSLERLGIRAADHLAEDLTAFYLERRWAGIDLYADTVPALAALRARPDLCRVGLLTNGNSYPDRSGLGHLFDATVFSERVGAAKPHPAIYAAAQEALPADRYALVGDSLQNDVRGAQAVGWLGCWVDREGSGDAAGAVPDRTVTTLLDVVPWVWELASGERPAGHLLG